MERFNFDNIDFSKLIKKSSENEGGGDKKKGTSEKIK